MQYPASYFATPEALFSAAREYAGGDDDCKTFFSDICLLGRFNTWISVDMAKFIKSVPFPPVERTFVGVTPGVTPGFYDRSVILPQGVVEIKAGQVFYKLTGGAYQALGTATEDQISLGGMKPYEDIGRPRFFYSQLEVPEAGTPVVVSGITQAADGVVTATAHGLPEGARVLFAGVVGMTQINGLLGTVHVLAANTFSCGIDTTAFTAYGSAGSVTVSIDVPVMTVHPYPIPSTSYAGTLQVRVAGRVIVQQLALPLIIPPQLYRPALEFLIWEIRRTWEKFTDADRANSKALYMEAKDEGIRQLSTIQLDRSIYQRSVRTVGK